MMLGVYGLFLRIDRASGRWRFAGVAAVICLCDFFIVFCSFFVIFFFKFFFFVSIVALFDWHAVAVNWAGGGLILGWGRVDDSSEVFLLDLRGGGGGAALCAGGRRDMGLMGQAGTRGSPLAIRVRVGVPFPGRRGSWAVSAGRSSSGSWAASAGAVARPARGQRAGGTGLALGGVVTWVYEEFLPGLPGGRALPGWVRQP